MWEKGTARVEVTKLPCRKSLDSAVEHPSKASNSQLVGVLEWQNIHEKKIIKEITYPELNGDLQIQGSIR